MAGKRTARPNLGFVKTSCLCEVGSERSLIRAASPRGFSLVELIVVLAVVSLLAGLLLPAVSTLREGANRIMCASNLHQSGTGMIMYGHDFNDLLPPSAELHEDEPQNLMMSRRGLQPRDWDGIGLLYQHGYCAAPECFYCPSHHGNHPFDRYSNDWKMVTNTAIYTNYHYCGDMDWIRNRRRSLNEGESLVLMTDGLRTQLDFNHLTGLNVLRGDGSVRWQDDVANILERLPVGEVVDPDEAEEYRELWNIVETGEIDDQGS